MSEGRATLTRVASDHAYPRVVLGRFEIVLGPKVWIALVLAIVIIVIGIVTTPKNVVAGILIAVSGILGTTIGTLLQPEPTPVDNGPRVAGALRGLATMSDSTRDTSDVVDRLVQTADPKTQDGLLTVQSRLILTLKEIELSMLDWEALQPGALDTLATDRRRGREALDRMSREMENKHE